MPGLSTQGFSVVEGPQGFRYVEFALTLTSPATTTETYSWYLQDVTASQFIEYDGASNSVTFSPGQSTKTIGFYVRGDAVIEPDKSLDLILIPQTNGALATGSSAMKATIRLIDDDGAAPVLGPNTPAVAISGPATVGGTSLATLDVRDVTVIEGDNGFNLLRFLVQLDRPTTVPITVSYFTQDGSGSSEFGAYDEASNSFTIPTGQSSTWVSVYTYGNVIADGDKTFQLVLVDPVNAVFSGNAGALVARATILEDDFGRAMTGEGGVGGFGAQLTGAASASVSLPTLSIYSAASFEGNSSWGRSGFVVMLDKPATVPVTFTYRTQDGTASSNLGDYDIAANTVTIPVGERSTYIAPFVNGDTAIERNETFQVIIADPVNAVLAGGAGALIATGTIIDNDSGSISGTGGIGGLAVGWAGPASASVSLPTLSVTNATVNEGNSSWTNPVFIVSLDAPATAPVTFRYQFMDGTASSMSNDYDLASNTVTIPAGERSVIISPFVNGDVAIESNESFQLTITNLSGAVFANNAATVVATGRIVDNDSGVLNMDGGVGGQGRSVAGPADTNVLPVVQAIATSGNEGNSSWTQVYVHVLLSKASATNITFQAFTSAGTAVAGDFDNVSNTFTIPAGVRSTVVPIFVNGDTAIEGDETFFLTIGNLTNAVFASGVSQVVPITIRDNDGTGTAGTVSAGPDFAVTALVGGAGDDRLEGGIGTDTLNGGAGNDLYFLDVTTDIVIDSGGVDTIQTQFTNVNIAAYAGIENLIMTGIANGTAIGDANANALTGNGGANQIFGLAGADTLRGGGGVDSIYGGDANDVIDGEEGIDLVFGEVGNDLVQGAGGNDLVLGGGGNDTLFGGADADTVLGEDGDDVVNGDAGGDVLWGGAGTDTVNGGAGIDYLYGQDGNDVLNGGQGINIYIGGEGGDIMGSGLTLSTETQIFYGESGVFTFAGGSLGNDSATGGSATDWFVMEGGNDTMVGGAGNDMFYGGDGADMFFLDDGAAAASSGDYAWGSAGADTFVSTYAASRIDVIMDFEAGVGAGDVLRLLGSPYASLEQVLAASVESGNFLIIPMGGPNAIYLWNVTRAQLAADDFLFA